MCSKVNVDVSEVRHNTIFSVFYKYKNFPTSLKSNSFGSTDFAMNGIYLV